MTVRLSERADLAANAAAFTAAVLFGASVVAVRVAVREIPPTTLAVLRFGLGAAVLLTATALVKPELLRLDRRSLRFVAVLGAIIFTLFPLSFNVGLQFIFGIARRADDRDDAHMEHSAGSLDRR